MLQAKDQVTGAVDFVASDDKHLTVAGYVWDTDLLDWVRATQAGGGVGGSGLTDGELRASPVGVTGTVTVSGSVSVSNLPAVQPVSDNGSSLTVDGSVSVLNFPVTYPVTGTFWQTTQPVSGTFWQATQPVSGTVTANLASGTNNIGDVDVASVTGTGSIANNQVSVTTSSAQVVAARAGRRALIIVQHGTTDVYLGTGTVTTGNGLLLKGTAGASISIPTTAAINGIVATGTQTVSYLEVF